MPAHYYQTVEMNEATDISDLVKSENIQPSADLQQGQMSTVGLWGTMENDRNKEFTIVSALTEMSKAMDEIYANAGLMQNFHTQEDIQKAIQMYYEYSQKQTALVSAYYNIMNSVGPARVIPYDPQAIPVFFIQFKDANDVQRGVYVYIGSWHAALYAVGQYGYLVGNFPAGTIITYGKQAYVI